MQPIGSSTDSLESTISLYKYKYFRSVGLTITNKIDPFSTTQANKIHRLDSIFPSIHSAIIVGQSNWSLIDDHGQITCLLLNPGEENVSFKKPICILPEISLSSDSRKTAWNRKFIAVTSGCPESRDFDFNVTTCLHEANSNKLITIGETDSFLGTYEVLSCVMLTAFDTLF